MAKSKYESNVKPHLELIESWCRDGDTDKTIAEKLKISQDTFYEYKKHYPEFSESLKNGKEIIDYRVENKLLKRALGYTFNEIKRETIQKEDGTEVQLYKVTETIKEVVPDVTAQIFWLKNRKVKEWRDKQEIELSANTEAFDKLKELYGHK